MSLDARHRVHHFYHTLAPLKRRKLPSSFSFVHELVVAREILFATRIQRFWRLSKWISSSEDAVDPLSWERLRLGGNLILVEPGGLVHRFNGRTLAKYYLCSADFRHPLTRRELWSWEVDRLSRKIDPTQGKLLKLTYSLRVRLVQFVQDARQELFSRTSVVAEARESLVTSFLSCEADMQTFQADGDEDASVFFEMEAALGQYGEALLQVGKISYYELCQICARDLLIFESAFGDGGFADSVRRRQDGSIQESRERREEWSALEVFDDCALVLLPYLCQLRNM